MDKLESLSVLVMADDYRIFEQLAVAYPGWVFHTLENLKQQGYHHRKNKRKSAIEKRADVI